MSGAASGPRSRGTARAGRGSRRAFASSVSRSSRFRSADVPDGSPIMPGPAARRGRPAGRRAAGGGERRDRHEVADVERRPGRVEAVVGGDRAARREARREAGRRVVEQAAPAQLVEEAGQAVGRSIGGVARRSRTSQRARAEAVSTVGPRGADRTAPHAIVPPTCRPAWRGASAIAHLAPRRRPRGATALEANRDRHPAPPLRRLPRRRRGRDSSGVVAAYSYYARACPNPEAAARPTSSSTSRRSSTTGPARSSWPASASASARSSTFDEIPPSSSTRRPRSRTRTSGSNPGFDLAGVRRRPRSTRSTAGRAAARRSPSSSSGPGSCRRAPSRAAARSGRSARSSSRSA